MADEQTPNPPQAPAPLSFLEKFNLPLSTLWNEYRLFFIGFGILILIFKFRETIIDLLVSSSRKTVSDATKEDAKLKAEETQANDQANQLRDQANKLDDVKPVIDEDWNKKK